MRTVVILRNPDTDEGTLGRVFVDFKPFCHSLELPDRSNMRNVSRIPAGEYRCVWHRSPRFGWVYAVLDVPGRSDILIHPGNWAGDKALGYRSDLSGCVALGSRVGRLAGQSAVMASRLAVDNFVRALGRQPFTLIIVEL